MSIIGQKSLGASRLCFKILEPGKGLKINSDTLHSFQMRWIPSSPNSSHWQLKQPTILMHNQCCRSMCPSFHSRWRTTSIRWSDQWTSKAGWKLRTSTIRTTLQSRTLGEYLKIPQRRPLCKEESQGSQTNYWLRSWESRCLPQTQMQWIHTPIEPNPIIIGGRGLKDALPSLKMKWKRSTKKAVASSATNKGISSASAQTWTQKERSQS